MNDAEAIKAKMIFLGLVHFESYGGFNRDEIVEKFEREFKKLELQPSNKYFLGLSLIDEPTIVLTAQKPGYQLDSDEFDKNIEYYRGVALHELTHKFLTRRNKEGQVIGTGLLKLVDRDPEFYEYLRTSKANKTMVQLSGIMRLFHKDIRAEEFGRGANEGYTEWFRKNILKEEKNMSYLALTSIFNIIQRNQEKRGRNAIEKMKQFKDGDYNYVFDTLNMSKEAGILFIRVLDCMYAIADRQEKIKKYLEAKKMQEELKKDGKNEELLMKLDRICTSFENEIRQLNRFKSCKSEQNFQDELNRYLMENEEKETSLFGTIETMLERADSKQDRKLEIMDAEDLQKDIMSTISSIATMNETEAFIEENDERPDEKMNNQGNEESEPEEDTRKIRKPSLTDAEIKRFTVRKDGRGLTQIINHKMKDMAYNMGYLVQNTFRGIILTTQITASVVGEIAGDIRYVTSCIPGKLKIMAVIAALIALGIPKGFSIRYLFDSNIPEIPAVEEIETDGNEIPERLQEPNETGEAMQQQEERLISSYFENGISLKKGDKVYKTSYQTESDITEMIYDYDNLYCDSVRVIKDNKILQEGTLENIDELYKTGIENNANVMLRTGVVNEDGTTTYIAWCNLDEIIEKSKALTKEQNDVDKESTQEEPEEIER